MSTPTNREASTMTDTTTSEDRVRAFLAARKELMDGAEKVGAPQLMPDTISVVSPDPETSLVLSHADLVEALNVAHKQGFAEGEAAAELQSQYADGEFTEEHPEPATADDLSK